MSRLRIPAFANDQGSMSLEAVVMAPAILLMLAALLYVGRYASVSSSIEGAASAAARSASLERTAPAASSAAAAAAQASLSSSGVTCSPNVATDTSGFATALGTPAQVRVDLSCAVDFSDLGLPGVPGQRTIRAQALSPLDAYRERS